MKNPVVLVTGASQGIGAAIAKVFAREVRGVRLALVARSEKKLRGVARSCAKSGAVAEVFVCDVSDEAAVGAMAKAVTRRFGTVDVLVNNAGGFAMAPFVETSTAMFEEMIGSNLRSAFLVSKAFVPAMMKRGRGDVFFMSSIAGLGAYPNSAAYCAAKFGVSGLAKVLRAETKGKGVRVCCVYPGATWSPSWKASGVKEERIMATTDVARAFLDAWRLSPGAVIEEIVVRPAAGDV